MFEVDGVDINDAKKAMTLAAAKLPIKCKFVERNIWLLKTIKIKILLN